MISVELFLLAWSKKTPNRSNFGLQETASSSSTVRQMKPSMAAKIYDIAGAVLFIVAEIL
jgi:hypothetical protein